MLLWLVATKLNSIGLVEVRTVAIQLITIDVKKTLGIFIPR
jgi:hypothetical protein